MLKHLAAALLIVAAPAGARASTAPESIADFAADRIVENCYAQFWQRYGRDADLESADLLRGKSTTPRAAFLTSCTIGRGKMRGARK
jgi:hypothetical protein